MKAFAASIIVVLMSSTTAGVVTHPARPAHQQVGLLGVVGPDVLDRRVQMRASRSAFRHPLVTRRARSVDAARHVGRVVFTSPSAIQRYALSLVGATQYSCLQPMWDRESHWDPNARNASGAYGIAQLMPDTWEAVGMTPTSDPRRQVTAGLAYISERYGSPCAAWAFWQQHGWY